MKLPQGWKEQTLGQLVKQPVSGVSVLGEDIHPAQGMPGVLRLSCVTNGRFNPEDVKSPLPSEVSRLRVAAERETILVSRSNTPSLVGASAFVPQNYSSAFLPDTLWLLRPHDAKAVSMRWLSFILLSAPYRLALQRIASGTSDSMKKIQKGAFLKLKVPTPPLPEQRKIADILTTWAEALEKLDALIEVQEQRKKALMQQLLTGRRRFHGFVNQWQSKRMDEVFTRVDRAIDGEPPHVLSITAGRGFVDQREKFSRVIAGSNIENYVLLKKGEFAYNKGNSDLYPQGCVYRLEEFDEGAVPNVWISFRLRSDAHSSLFYKHFFLYGGLNHGLHRLINAGVRNDGLLNLTAANFFTVEVPVPEPAEQAKIGELFETLAHSINTLRAKRNAIKHQKRGLMQRLLTGTIRVNTKLQ